MKASAHVASDCYDVRARAVITRGALQIISMRCDLMILEMLCA